MTEKMIMVVDDEKDIRDSIQSILESEGYEVITAENGDDCLQKLEGKNPDLILMDIMMPGMTVKEVVNQIKDTKIMYVSVVKAEGTEKGELLEPDNVVGYIQKPFDMEELVNKVEDKV